MAGLERPIRIDPRWIPADFPDPENFNFRFKFTGGEKKIMRKPRPIPASDWAERNRVLTMSSVPGRWKNSTTPYLAGIMDAGFFKSVDTVIICAAPQTGKSECVNNCIGYAADRRPGSVLYIYPDEITARENSRDRILPMFTSSPRLKSYMTGLDDDASYLRIKLRHMQIYMGWARSAARLSNKPLPYVVFDETDKYPATAGKKEADPISLGEKRTRTFRSLRKIWKLSTPTTEDGPIWRALTTEAQVVFDYHVRCPVCGGVQLMRFENIKWPEDQRDPQRVKEGELAWYECEKCPARWTDEDRDDAVRRGEWRARDKGLALMTYLTAHQPKAIGFHIPSWLSHFVSLSEVAARFLKGLNNKEALKDFLNADKAEPWKFYTREREEDRILALADDRPRGTVPGRGAVAALVAGVDTQDDGFYYEIRAFGWGMEKESWCVREGFVTTFDALRQVLWEDEYLDGDGNRYLVRFALQDAMGHRTAEVYDFVRGHRGRILPTKGEQRMNQPHAYSNIEYYPGTKKPIVGGVQLLRVNTQYYKNDLSNILEIAPADPGTWHYHADVTLDWALQMTAEHVNEKGVWECPSGRANHAWDCAVLCLAAADVIGVKHWKRPSAEEKTDKRMPEKTRPGGWIEKKAGWLG